MKRFLFFCFFFFLPLLGYAKYCPSCFETYQSQTIHGRTNFFYYWMIQMMDPKNPIHREQFQYLFDKKIKILLNGATLALGVPDAFQYFLTSRQNNPVLRARLERILVDQNTSIIKFQTVFQKNKKRYRSIEISILDFKKHKIVSWNSVAYVTLVR